MHRWPLDLEGIMSKDSFPQWDRRRLAHRAAMLLSILRWYLACRRVFNHHHRRRRCRRPSVLSGLHASTTPCCHQVLGGCLQRTYHHLCHGLLSIKLEKSMFLPRLTASSLPIDQASSSSHLPPFDR